MVFRKPSFIGINISDYVVFRKNAEEKQWQWKKENRSRKRQSITAVQYALDLRKILGVAKKFLKS